MKKYILIYLLLISVKLSAQTSGGFNSSGVASIDTSNFWHTLGNLGTNQNTNFLGTKDNNGLTFRTNNIPFFRAFTDQSSIFSNGNGLNALDNPTGWLHSIHQIDGGSAPTDVNHWSVGGNVNSNSIYVFSKSFGTFATPTTVGLGQILGTLRWDGHCGSQFRTGASIRAFTDATSPNVIATNSLPTMLQFSTRANLNTSFLPSVRMTILSNGFVGVNTVAPLSTFDINGTIGSNSTITTTNATYTVIQSVNTIIANNGAANITITLPDPSLCLGREYSISRYAGSTGTITIRNTGTQSIQSLSGTIGLTTSLSALGSYGQSARFKSVLIGGVWSWIRIA